MAFSEDGTRLATGGDDGTTYIWNIRDRTGPIALRGHQRDVWHAAFTPDGRRLISSDSDGVVRIWNTDGTGSPLVLDEFRAPTRTVATLPGERYVTAHDDGTIWVWRCQACAPVEEVVAEAGRNSTRELTAEERRIYLPES